jgi:TolB-like protein/Flp pilus assembly protein TadD
MPSPLPRRLDSWKAIADYLGRSVRTAVRWADERGLPVHHVPGGKRHAVFSFTNEIDDWLMSTKNFPEADRPAEKSPPSEERSAGFDNGSHTRPNTSLEPAVAESSPVNPELEMAFESLSEIVKDNPGSHRKAWILGGGFIALFAVATVFFFAMHSSHAGSSANARAVRIAILPVNNLTGDVSREVFTDGLTEELITHLGRLNPREMEVIARTSSMAYKKSDKSLAQIARELNVDYVLESSMRGSPSELKFSTQLIRMRDQSSRWSQEYDRSPSDLMKLEYDLGRDLAKQIGLHGSPLTDAKLDRSLEIRPESHLDYLQGRYYWNQRSREGLDRAFDFFYKAIDEDTKNARAYSGLADTYNMSVFYGYSSSAAGIVKAQEAAQHALQLDPSLAEAHASMAYVNFMWAWEWTAAEHEFRRALELDANYVPAHHWYALYLASMGRHAEADREIRTALSLDPYSSAVQTAAGYVHFFGRDYDTAILECQLVLKRDPAFGVAHSVLGLAYEGKGQYAQAIAEFRTVDQASGGHVPYYKGPLGHAYAMSGDLKSARKMLAELDQMAVEGSYASQTSKAIILVALGEKENALDALERARGQNDASLIWLTVDSRFDPIRSEPRFQKILQAQERFP